MEKTVDWERFNDQFVRLKTGIEKRLRLKNWQGGDFFGRPGIEFDVLQEDDKKDVKKQFTVTSRRLIRLLKPILLEAEEEGRDTIAVSILRLGDGMNTRYKVEQLPPSFKELFR